MTPGDVNTIQETATWCLNSFHKPESPWAKDWTPSCLVGIPETDRLARFVNSNWREAITHVAESRRASIVDLPKPVLSRDPDSLTDFRYCLLGGRFFQVFLNRMPRSSDCQRANEVSSGFFDLSGLPVWDTWAMARTSSTSGDVLIGWIPNSLTVPVGDAMYWFKDNFAEWVTFSELAAG